MKYALSAVVVMGGMIACGGCGGGKKIDTVTVNGKLFVDGKPYGPATIVLQPAQADGETPSASGDVAEDGTFKLVSGKDLEGAVPGTYKVTVAEDVMSGKAVPKLEAMTVEIQKSDGGAVTLEIKMKSIKGKKVAGPGTDDDASGNTGTGLVP